MDVYRSPSELSMDDKQAPDDPGRYHSYLFGRLLCRSGLLLQCVAAHFPVVLDNGRNPKAIGAQRHRLASFRAYMVGAGRTSPGHHIQWSAPNVL